MEQESILNGLGDEITQIVTPVSICMILTVVMVRVLNGGGDSSNDRVAIASLYYKEDEDDTTGTKLGGAVVNALIFVAIIALMTFGLFLCFKYRLTKCIYAYMSFAGFMIFFLLMGGMIADIIKDAGWHFDVITFVFLLFNYAVGGVTSIFFWPAPLALKQAYLVVLAIVVAYIFTWIPQWTTWVLLVAMALYDLCAVLMPGGPLKALVELAISRDEDIPALVYEARPTNNTQVQSRPRQRRSNPSQPQPLGEAVEYPLNHSEQRPHVSLPIENPRALAQHTDKHAQNSNHHLPAQSYDTATQIESDATQYQLAQHNKHTVSELKSLDMPPQYEDESTVQSSRSVEHGWGRYGEYIGIKPPTSSNDNNINMYNNNNDSSRHHCIEMAPTEHESTTTTILSHKSEVNSVWSGQEEVGLRARRPALHARSHVISRAMLVEQVTCTGLSNVDDVATSQFGVGVEDGGVGSRGASVSGSMGGVAVGESVEEEAERQLQEIRQSSSRQLLLQGVGSQDAARGAPRSQASYEEQQATNRQLRSAPTEPTAIANGNGRHTDDEGTTEFSLPNAIKLGLGDFIFYSLLVGRASMYDMLTVFAAFIAIITGLVATLLLLAVYQKALPALPISIALGVAFYFMSRELLEPFVLQMALHQAFF